MELLTSEPRQRWMAGFLVLLAAMGIGWQIVRWWTRPAAVEFDNLKYIQLLTTAVSSRKLDMLERVEKAIRQRHQSGEMSERELSEFEKLIQMCRDGHWSEADKGCFALAEAQLNRSRSRPAERRHAHDHQH